MCLLYCTYKLIFCHKTINHTYHTKWICETCKKLKYKTIHPDYCSLYERRMIHTYLMKKREKMNKIKYNYKVTPIY